ncbi:MAG: hypothetical protein PHO18_07535 [Synergistaceae bacterium]|nr:hypothetical protein [Synergistaceae bacterium]
MRKTFFLLIFFLLTAPSLVYAADNENTGIADSFKAYCRTEMNKVFETYSGDQYSIVYKKTGNKPEHWTKHSEKIENAYGVDFQKAEVPGEPDTGILIVKHFTEIYADNYDSEEDAKAETAIVNRVKYVYKFYMSYQNKQWVLTKAMRYTHWQKKWHSVTPTSIFEILQSKNDVKQ